MEFVQHCLVDIVDEVVGYQVSLVDAAALGSL